MKRIWYTLTITSFLFTSMAYAETPAKVVPPPEAKASVLWDSWYTVTLSGKVPYGYYNDRIEKKDGKIAFKNQFWKREEGHINEEQLVAFAEDNTDLTPLLFNFSSNYRDSQIDIDGNIQSGKITVKVRKSKQTLKPISRSIPKKTFFSSMFPVWVGKRSSELKQGKLISFSTILEDNVDRQYAPVAGSLRMEKPDEYATKNNALQLAVTYQDRKSTWYVAPSGETLKIVMHDQNAVVEKTTEAAARKFLIAKDGL